ncbi:fused MFS/spermidine synthase [Endozoicomonas sp. G2_1]|uniref:spermidine synthase n=1 Tax=Endozoicomonas sp. G2_1 TaxID=2821091 RepID=UPI001ADAAA42|nr:fused MFS/spermidine synthase [Endozoicomonas sp. G2_1]MBO9491538.1 fused MFS/spermidine synthase [Endozoicomonas sp. G2_1]
MLNKVSSLAVQFSAAIALTITCASSVSAKVIHSERSLYRNIIVEDKKDIRCLKFTVKRNTSNQSCMSKSNPQKLIFSYTKLLFAGLLAQPEPERVLIIGLGGGTISNTLHQLFPDITIDNVEIDPAVVKVAKEYFAYLENDKIQTIARDGRIFVKRALVKKQQYDWIILDAFNGDYIPEHLMTREFLQEVKALLSEQGIVLANTFSISRLYDYESATYHDVFGDFYNVSNENGGNRIILAGKNGRPARATMTTRASQLKAMLTPFGVDLEHVNRQISERKDWPENTRILTDQYSPANLLK